MQHMFMICYMFCLDEYHVYDFQKTKYNVLCHHHQKHFLVV